MRRQTQLRSWALLQMMFRKAMGRVLLAPAFNHAIKLMATTGLHPQILKSVEYPRRILISPEMGKMTNFRGVYFGNLEPTFPEDTTNWKALGWDGVGRFLMFPDDDPRTWVILHEFAHYLEDVFFRKSAGDFLALGYHPSKISQFVDWKQEARYEFRKAHGDALSSLTEEQRKDPLWYEQVSFNVAPNAPSRYGLLTFSEWLAENFRRYYIDGPDFVEYHCPEMYKFLDFTLTGKMFHHVIEPAKETVPLWIPYIYEGGHQWEGTAGDTSSPRP